MATPCALAVGSSTPLESPWLHWPEARGCVQVPEVRVEGPPSCLHLHQGLPSMPPSFAPAQLTS